MSNQEEINNSEEMRFKKIINLFNTKQLKEMLLLSKTFVKDYPKNLHGKNALALGLKAIGRFEDSKNIYLEIIKENPRNKSMSYIYSNAGNLFYDIGQIDNAINLYNIGIEINPEETNSFLGLGLAYSNKGMDKKSIEIYLEALKFDDSNNTLNFNLANSLRKVKRFKEAAYYYSKTSNRLNKSYQLECLYLDINENNKEGNFFNLLNDLNEKNINDPLIASISSHASINFEEKNRCNFCKSPFDFIRKENLIKNNNLDQNLINQVLIDLDKSSISKKSQSLLNKGVQSSGNLFNLEFDSIQSLRNIISMKISEFREFYKDSNNDFITNWPKNYDLYGWIIIMDSGGNLLPHIHKEGWLSGSLYLKRPKKLEKHDGDIEFSLHGGGYPLKNKVYPKKIIDIEYGDIILFPSSIFHSTQAFISNEKRITLAFDIIPHEII